MDPAACRAFRTGRPSGTDAPPHEQRPGAVYLLDQIVHPHLRKYELTIDRAEAASAEAVLSRSNAVAMEVRRCVTTTRSAAPASREGTGSAQDIDALARWDDNGNGRITCPEARRHGIAPVPRDHPAYRYMRDGDGDGVVCE